MVKVDKETCIVCESCVAICPMEAISVVDEAIVVDEAECIECGTCEESCALGAISVD